MSVFRIAIQTASLKLPFRKALLTAARLGAEAVEIDARNEVPPREMTGTGLRQLRKMLADLNLGVSAIGFATRRGYNDPDELDARVQATKAALKMAHDLGAGVVVNHVGQIPAEPTGPAWTLLIEALTDLGRYGDRIGARLAARTGAEDGPTLAKLIAALPDGTVGVDLDPGALAMNGFSTDEAIRALGRHILHVHVTDGVRDFAQRRGIAVTLGRGSVDYAAVLGQLEQHAYRGYLTIERRGADDPTREIGAAVEYLRRIQE